MPQSPGSKKTVRNQQLKRRRQQLVAGDPRANFVLVIKVKDSRNK